MPLDRTGPCPFAGDHWPLQWVGQNITRANFSSLNSGQKKDLIEYYYENQYATVATAPFKSRKPYRFPINQLRDYFGRVPADLKKIVKATPEYAEYVAERQRSQAPPPPPEMPAAPIAACQASEPPAAPIAACQASEPPEEEEAARRAGDHTHPPFPLTTEPTNGASPSPPEMLAAAAALADAVRLAKELLHRVARPEAEVPSMAPRRLPESEVASTHPFPGRKPVRPPALHPSNLSLLGLLPSPPPPLLSRRPQPAHVQPPHPRPPPRAPPANLWPR